MDRTSSSCGLIKNKFPFFQPKHMLLDRKRTFSMTYQFKHLFWTLKRIVSFRCNIVWLRSKKTVMCPWHTDAPADAQLEYSHKAKNDIF